MDSLAFSTKNINTRDRDDRFVLPRDYIAEIRRRSWHAGDSVSLDLNYSIGENLKRRRFVDHLDKSLGILKDPGKQLVQLWPCNPRKTSYLSTADSVLDLPTYSSATFPELLDWSKDNVLVAALGSSYHKWSWNSQNIVSRVYTRYEIQSCKFDPRGELLLLGTHMQRVEIHNNARNKRVGVVLCEGERLLCAHRHRSDVHFCSITALDWSPTGNSFVMGCSFGVVMSVTRCAKVINLTRVVPEPIYLVRVSPDTRFVAVCVVNSAAVMLLTWPTLKKYFRFYADWLVKTITWHPWRSALLAVGAVTSELQASVAVFHAPTRVVCERGLAPRPYCLDAMLFSERSGELVTSLWNTENLGSKIYSQLVVFGDPETVVDQWGDGPRWPDRVRTMVFNPDGTKLATATLDEDLIIWNFLPEDKRDKKAKRKRFLARPVLHDMALMGLSVR
ncbi:protein cortex-like [Maniola hyperantus]|uniref:protein cortex-like n=1 Tax=Aphantopus hyperantus TaxID=2795564 RepID=UPI001569F55A|nr:protein cortex [Maniola hyperantus]